MSELTCFVIMGFGEKTDYQTQRTLNLDKTYRGIIKPAVEACGLKCVRADDIIHAGTIDKPMYELLLDADLVIADLSTANVNAVYELGVRHALRPNTTIIMVEEGFQFPFDLNHLVFRTYEHLGKGIDFEEAERMKGVLKTAIHELVHGELQVDSPVYTFIENLEQPERSRNSNEVNAGEGLDSAAAIQDVDIVFSTLLEKAQAARENEQFDVAKVLFQQLYEMRAPKTKPDPYIVQQLALATYKCPQTNDEGKVTALYAAKEIIEENLHPSSTNDPETLGLWGAIHKRLWELSGQAADLDASIWSYERGFYLKRDYYNGINYAFMLNVRAAQQTQADEATADRVLARRVRKQVLVLVEDAQKKLPKDENRQPVDKGEAYWMSATRLEALMGLGEIDRLNEESEKLFANAPEGWMPDSTKGQLEKLKTLL